MARQHVNVKLQVRWSTTAVDGPKARSTDAALSDQPTYEQTTHGNVQKHATQRESRTQKNQIKYAAQSLTTANKTRRVQQFVTKHLQSAKRQIVLNEP